MDADPIVSQRLRSALQEFRPFLETDDLIRSHSIAATDRNVLEALARTVDPLFGEINSLLDDAEAWSGQRGSGERDLESDLHSLAQAAMEARSELDRR